MGSSTLRDDPGGGCQQSPDAAPIDRSAMLQSGDAGIQLTASEILFRQLWFLRQRLPDRPAILVPITPNKTPEISSITVDQPD